MSATEAGCRAYRIRRQVCSPVEAVADFFTDLRESRLGGAHELIPEEAPTGWPDAVAVGGWWNRSFDPEIDPGVLARRDGPGRGIRGRRGRRGG
jgi:hypothetical protein